MARRFGGEFSPDKSRTRDASGNRPENGAPVVPGDRVRSYLLFLFPLPLAFRAFGQEPVALVTSLLALGLLIFSAWLTQSGLKAEAEWNARKVARRPVLPRKIIGAVLSGAGVALAGFAGIGGLFGPLAMGLLAAACHFVAFGPDPLSDKGMEGIDRFQADRVARVIEGAEEHIEAMQDAILRANDPALEDRVADFRATARTMFRTVEEDPRDLTAARKYLSVYLQGARDATAKYADIAARGDDADARADYVALIDDLETHFTSRTKKLLADGQDDLDVEIEVLRERLSRDGIRDKA